MNDLAISVNNVSKNFDLESKISFSKLVHRGKRDRRMLKALDNISFTLKKGEILGLIGLNGSGKTTLLKIIAGIYRPDTGNVEVNGRMSQLMQLGIGFQGELNASENIIIYGLLLGIKKKEIEKRVNDIIQYAELEKFIKLKIKHFSTGMRARLAFAIAMQINPDILLIDEILSVGDKNFQEKSYNTFLSYTKNKKTIIHASHNLKKLEQFSDKILLLHKGKQIILGDPHEVIQKYHEIKPKS